MNEKILTWLDKRPNIYNGQFTNGEILTAHIVVVLMLIVVGICGNIGG